MNMQLAKLTKMGGLVDLPLNNNGPDNTLVQWLSLSVVHLLQFLAFL